MFGGYNQLPRVVPGIFVSIFLLMSTVVGGAQDYEVFNNGNRFLRWRQDNEIVFAVEEGEPHYASKVLLRTKSDTLYEKWRYDDEYNQIIGVNDFCLGVGGQYEIMLKDCEETIGNTIWHVDEFGRLIGIINVQGDHETRCAQGVEENDRIELKYVDCSDDPRQLFELEGTNKTLDYAEIRLLEAGKAKDYVFNEITNNQDLEELTKAVHVLEAEDFLREEEFTIFVPSDQAFEDLGEKASERLRLPENEPLLNEIVAHHVVPELLSSEKVLQKDKVINIRGKEIDIIGNTIENAEVVEADLSGRNGIIHIIDQVIIPQDIQSQVEEVIILDVNSF